MLKKVTVILTLFMCCYCLESNDMLTEETRAKKKKNSLRLLAMILLFVFSKVAIFKVASFFMFMAFFQKLFYMAGIAFSYFMKNPPAPTPILQPTYGAPQDYNTLGYSYGPPDHEPFQGPESGLPSIADFGGTIHNLFKKQ